MRRGEEAEREAAAFLERRGLRVVARNWRCKGGEIDLIAEEGGTLVFVEVRARKNAVFGGAAASITAGKQARLIHAAQAYLAGLGRVPACRFDAVLFEGDRVEWLRDVIQT